ncbi:hypothetical protein NQ315_003020 [Exocentrus adspersus]|uniref:MADF domain-containing protein n=1 Tax=Exocentrus adspersus TaxID=1586481 RepID=A0AAV8W4Y5_9CUCU|nr:hypothetical protein NQ315_003020 [Exocentrus adspersus]
MDGTKQVFRFQDLNKTSNMNKIFNEYMLLFEISSPKGLIKTPERINDCKTRWRSLRDLYHRKRKDVKKGKRSRSHWEYMDMLGFLDNFSIDKKFDTKKEEDTTDPKEEDSNETKTGDQFPSNNYMNIIALPFGMSDQHSFKLPNPEDTKIESKKIKTEPTEEATKIDGDIVHLLRDIRDATQVKQHPIKLFFDSMASTVMGFPPSLAAEAKLKVCQIVSELECRMLDEAGCVDGEANF